jgi:hypothetical protein
MAEVALKSCHSKVKFVAASCILFFCSAEEIILLSGSVIDICRDCVCFHGGDDATDALQTPLQTNTVFYIYCKATMVK